MNKCYKPYIGEKMTKINATFNIEQRGTSFVVIDSLGYLCGIYDTQANAEIAIPKIKASIKRGFIHDWLLKAWEQRRYQNRQQNRQSYRNNSTARRSNQTQNK